MVRGQVVPLLGAGANLCGRPEGATWQLGRYLPDGAELAAHLASSFEYPTEQALELSRVSQYVAVMAGSGPLYQELRQLFDADYPPSKLHQLLAGLPALAREQPEPRYQLLVTTNYDDALERAFRDKGEEFDLVWYAAEGDHRGKFLHFAPSGDMHVVERPNEYARLSPDQRTVILKIHGAVDRTHPDLDSFVITEDHYIDYLARSDISNLLPVTLAVRLQRSHFLFLGYSMRDWNLRVILHRIWGTQALNWTSWAVQRYPEPIEERLWRKRGVEILHAPLEHYIVELSRHLTELQRSGRS
jgi:hypothetical protein